MEKFKVKKKHLTGEVLDSAAIPETKERELLL